MFPTTFFPSWYFPPAFYARDGGSSNNTFPSQTMSAYHDRDAFSAISSALKATGIFADVSYGTADDLASAGADRFPLALIEPKGWSESLDSDPSFVIRRITFDLRLVVRDEHPRDRYEALDELMSVVQTALNGSTLGGGCLSAQTRLLQGRFDATRKHPEGQLVISGQFAYRGATN